MQSSETGGRRGRRRGGAGAPRVCAAIALGVVGAGSVHAADWLVTPRVTARATATDNVALAAPSLAESDLVTEIAPGVSVRGRGARLQLSADYAFIQRLYANRTDGNGHSHALRSNALVEMYEDHLFLNANATISQQDISTLSPTSASNVNLTGNRTDVRRLALNPYWLSRLGTWANLRVGYLWDTIDSSGAAAGANSTSSGYDLGLRSGRDVLRLGWSVDYTKREVEYASGTNAGFRSERLTGALNYAISPTLRATATLGFDDYQYVTSRNSTSGRSETVGLDWAPGPRTRLTVSIGRRYFGRTAALSFSHRTRATTWSASYRDEITSSPYRFGLPVATDTAAVLDDLFATRIPDPVERARAIEEFIRVNNLPASLQSTVDFTTTSIYRTKRLSLGTGWLGVRNTVLLNAFIDQRTSEGTGTAGVVIPNDPFQFSNDVEQIGLNASWSMRFSPEVSGTVSASFVRSEYSQGGRTDDNFIVRASIGRQLSRRVRGSIDVRHVERTSDASTGYRENAVTGNVTVGF